MTTRNAVKAGGAIIDIVANNLPLINGLKSLPTVIAGLGIGSAIGSALVEGFQNGMEIRRIVKEGAAVFGTVAESEIDGLVDAVISAARKSKLNSRQIGEIIFGAASSGIPLESLQNGALEVLADFAEAAKVAPSRAPELLVDSLSGLGKLSEDSDELLNNMQRLADLLVDINQEGRAEAGQIAQAVSKSAGILTQLGISVEEQLALAIQLANSGVKGPEGGTAIAGVFQDLTNKAVKNREAFGDLELFEGGEFVGASEALRRLEADLSQYTTQGRIARIQQLQLNETTARYIGFLGDGSDILKTVNSLQDASGKSAQTAANSMTDYERSVAELSGAWDEFSTTLGENPAVSGAVSTAILTLAEALNELNAAVEENAVLDFLGRLAETGSQLPRVFGGRDITGKDVADAAVDAIPGVGVFKAGNQAFLRTELALFKQLDKVTKRDFSNDIKEIEAKIAGVQRKSSQLETATEFQGGQVGANSPVGQVEKALAATNKAIETFKVNNFSGSAFSANEFIAGMTVQQSSLDRQMVDLLAKIEGNTRRENEPSKTIALEVR